MTGQDLTTLLTDLRHQPQEQQWLEFKVNAITKKHVVLLRIPAARGEI
jgi:hypothetical protein